MKWFQINWERFLDLAGVWSRLSAKSQQSYLELQDQAETHVSEFGDDLQAMVEHHLLTDEHPHCRVHEDGSEFSRAIRAMSRYPMFQASADVNLKAYVKENFDADQRRGFGVGGWEHYGSDAFHKSVTSAHWCHGFLRAKDAQQWERLLLRGGTYVPPLLKHSAIAKASRQVILWFFENPRPVPFAELQTVFQTDMNAEILAGTVFVCIRYLLLFPGLNDDRQPVLGLWPDVAKYLSRPKPEPPESAQAVAQFSASMAVEDLTTLLLAAAAEPLPLRVDDHDLYAKVLKQLQASLLSAPNWLSEKFIPDDPPQRLRLAMARASKMGLGRTRDARRPTFVTTTAGEKWLSLSPKSRLKDVIELIRRAMQDTWNSSYGSRGHEPTLPNLMEAARDACRWLDGRAFVPVFDFVVWKNQTANPYIEMAKQGNTVKLRNSWSYHQPTPEEMEKSWMQDMFLYLWELLYSVGGLKFGHAVKSGLILISLTDIGRYVLGLTDDFEYGVGGGEAAQIVVQPNFDVVFLSSSPSAELALSRFAERAGTARGVLFKLTKSAIFSAAATGTPCEGVLDTLQQLSTKELPANVIREIRGWFGQCRKVTVKSAVLIRCPDIDTAARVLSASGKKGQLLTDTIVELTDSKAKQAVLKKMKLAGIFVAR